MSTAVTALTANMQLPAHLMTESAAAMIAAANAAAAGGIKTGGFPRISIKGGKFHEVENGETRTYMNQPVQGQPPLPMMCLEVAVLNANPALTKTYYPGDYKDGDDSEPVCSSDNGVTPDSHITAPQSSNCASCPQNQWGSKISKASGKDVKACNDSKRLAVIPAGDLTYKALGLAITPASLGEWGKYVKALSDKKIPVNAVVTNLTFDSTAAFPKLQFAFNRFLTADEFAKAQERAEGDDVKTIVAPTRSITVARVALPAPTVTAPVAAIAQVIVDPYEGQMVHVKPTVESAGGLTTSEGRAVYKALTGKEYVAPVATVTTATPPPAQHVVMATTAAVAAPNGLPAGAAATTGFGAPVAAAPAPAAEPPKRTRRTREQIAADNAASGAVPPHLVAPVGVDPALVHLPANILTAVQAVGKDSPAGQALMAMHPAPAAAPVAVAPAPAPIAPPPAVAAPAVAAPAAQTASADVVNAAMSLKDKLAARLKQGAGAPAGATIQ